MIKRNPATQKASQGWKIVWIDQVDQTDSITQGFFKW